MGKSTELLKRLVALFLLVLLSFESFAAVVGDNDGTAFITKAEFEVLKNDFNAQIDRYNNSIDSKIDGKISDYLGGLRTAKKIERSVISYDEDGIVSIENKNTLPWTEGYINIYGTGIHGRINANSRDIQDPWNAGEASGKSNWNSLPYIGNWHYDFDAKTWNQIQAFKEMAIYDVDWTNLTARWGGYCTTKYRWLQRQYSTNDTGWSATYVDDRSLYLHPYGGWEPLSSTPTSIIDWSVDHKVVIDLGVAPTATAVRYNNFPWFTDFSFFERNIIETKNLIAITTKPNNKILTFTNYDGFYDFQNDGYAPGATGQECTHSGYQAHYNDIFGNVSVYAPMIKRNGTQDADGFMYGIGLDSRLAADETYWKKLTFQMNNHEQYPSTRSRYQNPYIGFTYNYIDNMNQLWTNVFDTYIADMEVCDANVNIIKDKDEKKHLALTAGLPICKVEKEGKIKLPLEFSDNADHYVWIKTKSFSSTVNPQDDTDCVTSFEKITKDGVEVEDMTSLIDTTLRCVKVPANKNITVYTKDMGEDSYIFIKWSKTNNSCAGGGTFITPKYVMVETVF